MIRKTALIATLVALPLALAAQQPKPPTYPAPAVGASSTSLHQQFAAYWEWRLAESPELATQVGRAECNNDRWRDWSKSARDRARVTRNEFLQQMLYIGTGNLTLSERLSAHLLEHELRAELEGERYLQLVQRVSQMNGAHNQVFTVFNQMPSRTAKDYENIVARLRALPVYIDQTIALMREQLEAGIAQPAVVVDRIVDQLAAQSRPAAMQSPLLAAFRSVPADMPAAARSRLTQDAIAADQQQFVPSWKRFASFFTDTYRGKVRSQVGLSAIPDGQAAYELLARALTRRRG